MSKVSRCEYRKQGMRLFFENSSRWQLFSGALLASILFSLSWAVLLTVLTAFTHLFSLKSFFLYGLASESIKLGGWLLLPWRLLHEFWLVDIYVALLFLGAALFVMHLSSHGTKYKKGWEEVSNRIILLLLFLPVILLGTVLLWLVKDSTMVALCVRFSEWYLLLPALIGFSFIFAWLLYFSWPCLWFLGLLLYHRYFVYGPSKVTRARIDSYFVNLEPW